MPIEENHKILFEPVKIGPKTAKNRFYQVPHCNGMGHRWPRTMAEMRGVKAEGGWAVVCTEECQIHPSSDITPAPLMRLWDDTDLPIHELMVSKVQEHGALAGIQLVHNGLSVCNYMSRMVPIGPSAAATETSNSTQARAMDKSDIKEVRRWFREGALRARRAGYDLIYVYAAHGIMTLLYQFLLRRFNHRTDEYGGSLENRVRLLREILQDTKDTVGHDCAVAMRFAVDELLGEGGMQVSEAEDIVGMLAELPDLWDVNVADWSNDSRSSRFSDEGFQEGYIKFVKQTTSKPVVGVGRFTSPDTMVSQIKRGVLDFIGGARPSIADPFIPKKIEEGRSDEIRECIGCNLCTSGDTVAYPMRCTQNPTMGEEWRKGWHPEKIEKAGSDAKVLIVGGGPAGLEAALALSNRSYEVTIADSNSVMGGRVLQETGLKPLNKWKRVSDYRTYMLSTRGNVQSFVESALDASQILELGCSHVAIATGSYWKTDFVGAHHRSPTQAEAPDMICTPEMIFAGDDPGNRIMVYDDDHYYLGSAIAEHLAEAGKQVVLVTPDSEIASWTRNTLENGHIQVRLRELGVEIICNHAVGSVKKNSVTLECVFIGTEKNVEVDSVIPVTARESIDGLYEELNSRTEEWSDHGIKSITRIGDCYAPGPIAMAVYSGHQYARNLEATVDPDAQFKRENDFEIGKH